MPVTSDARARGCIEKESPPRNASRVPCTQGRRERARTSPAVCRDAQPPREARGIFTYTAARRLKGA
jgi:hypothetical protein